MAKSPDQPPPDPDFADRPAQAAAYKWRGWKVYRMPALLVLAGVCAAAIILFGVAETVSPPAPVEP